MKASKAPKKPLILIIDDNSDSLNYLCDIFYDYRKSITTSGLEGIQLANNIKPDLILLDVVMPEINGFEVCKIIKENPDNKDIPIIFLTGKSQVDDVVKGFQIGAIDYITKPFESEELIMRVKNNLELKFSRDIIKEQNEKMKELNDDLKDFLNIATHDLKNSLIVIQGFLKIILKHYENFTITDIIEIINDVSVTSDNMYRIVNNLLLISKLEAGEYISNPSNIDISFLFNESIEYYKKIAEVKNSKLIYKNQITETNLNLDYKLIKECIDNLISNAIKFSPKNSSITIKSYLNNSNKELIIEVDDEGPGIKKSEQTQLYKKFAKMTNLPTNNELKTGLGLALTKLIVNLLNGSINHEPLKDKGTKFILRFPIQN